MKFGPIWRGPQRHGDRADLLREAVTTPATRSGSLGTRGMSSCPPARLGRSAEIIA